MNHHLYLIRAISPIHYGTGQGVGDIDLPISKDPITKHPRLPGSGIKGVLRDHFEQSQERYRDKNLAIFGPANSDHASALSMGEARLLALPVRSYFGSFAFLTSPLILCRLKEQAGRAGLSDFANLSIPEFSANAAHYHASITHGSCLTGGGIDNRILLEEVDLILDTQHKALTDAWADAICKCFAFDADTSEVFKCRFVITDGNVLDFLSETSLPVEPHIAIDDDTGTVKGGALWFEENVPVETLFVGQFTMDRSYGKAFYAPMNLSSFFIENMPSVLQVGGKSTTGKGFVEIKIAQPEHSIIRS